MKGLFKLFLAMFILMAGCLAAAQQMVTVTGDAEIKVVPDQVVIFLGVEVHAETLDQARHNVDSRVRSVRAAAADLGVEQGDMQTDFIQVGMQYQDDGITPRYYYARKSIVLVVHKVDRMEEVLAASIEAGATHIHGVEFETTKLREFRDQARALAVQAATEKARDMAGAAGMKVVGGPRSISSVSYNTSSWYRSGWGGRSLETMSQNVVFAGETGKGGPQSSIALGRISVSASVAMQFQIE